MTWRSGRRTEASINAKENITASKSARDCRVACRLRSKEPTDVGLTRSRSAAYHAASHHHSHGRHGASTSLWWAGQVTPEVETTIRIRGLSSWQGAVRDFHSHCFRPEADGSHSHGSSGLYLSRHSLIRCKCTHDIALHEKLIRVSITLTTAVCLQQMLRDQVIHCLKPMQNYKANIQIFGYPAASVEYTKVWKSYNAANARHVNFGFPNSGRDAPMRWVTLVVSGRALTS